MAASGGHWVKSLAPGGNEYTFIPAFKDAGKSSYVFDNYEMYGTGSLDYTQGGLGVVYMAKDPFVDKYAVVHLESGSVIGKADNLEGAMAMATSLNATGMNWKSSKAELVDQYEKNGELKDAVSLIKNTYSGMPADVAKTHTAEYIQNYQKMKAQGATEVYAPAPKTSAPTPIQVASAGQPAAPSASFTAPASHTEFMAKAGDVPITTIMGKQQTATGIVSPDGKTAITYNSNTNNYHVVDMATGKTIEKTSSLDAAYKEAANYGKQSVNIAPPANSTYKEFTSSHEGTQAFAAASKNQTPVTHSEASSLSSYQDGGYGSINDHLWGHTTGGSSTLQHIKNIDSAMKSHGSTFPFVSQRTKEKGSHLYNFAKHANVGDQYASKGYDSSSIAPGWSWGGAAVRLVYRVPPGVPGVHFNTLKGYSSTHPGEHEFLFGRNLSWNIVGKSVTPSGNITLTLEYAGTFNP